MRDYLEELLDLLTQEDEEEAAGVWKTQTAALPWISVRDPQGLQSKNLALYNVSSLPTFFLIDRTNTLQKRDAQIKDLDAELQVLLN